MWPSSRPSGSLSSGCRIRHTCSYTYDEYGNLKTTTLKDGSTATFTLQNSAPNLTSNRLATINGVTAAYDNVGFMTSYGSEVYTYDALGMMVRNAHDATN